jgi:putative spermidine/putrescine transport system ATP-binding protein
VAEKLLGRSGSYALRPERVSVLPDDALAPAGLDSVAGTVSEVVFAGPSTRLVVQSEAGLAFTVLLRGRADAPARGARVLLAWDPADAYPVGGG